MLKIIGFIFILFSGISLIVIASLFTGFEIDQISYKNINIKKLYLKYDKKLNISTSEISIIDQISKQSTKMKTTLTLDYKNDLFELDIKEFHLNNTDIEFEGLVYIDKDLIDLNKKSQIMVEDAKIVFDKKMKQITAKNVFIDLENNIINLSLTKPYYGDVDITGTQVSFLIDKKLLKLYLKTKSLVNNTIKDALARYDVEINTIQHDGKNDISANIFIPFEKGDIFIEANMTILDSNIENYGQKYKVNKLVLHYQDKLIQGTMNLNKYTYEDINITNSTLNYTINFNNGFRVKVNAEKINLQRNQEKYKLNKTLLDLNNNKLIFSSNITDEAKYLDITFDNKTNFFTRKSEGKINLKYDNLDNKISLKTDKIVYNADYNDLNNIQLDVNSKNIHLLNPENINIKNLSVKLKDNKIKTNLFLEDKKKRYKLDIVNETDLNTKLSYGNITVDKIIYKNLLKVKNKNIPYNLSFNDHIVLNSPMHGLTYFKDNSSTTHKLIISNPNKLLEAFTFIKMNPKSNGFIDIESDDLKNTLINISDISFDINSTYFKPEKNNTKSARLDLPLFPKLQLKYTNSDIKYDDFTLSFDKIDLNTNNNILNLNIIKDNSILDLHTENNSVFFHGTNLTDKYVNNFLNKEILEDGYMELNVYGEDLNLLSGDMNFHKTTIKNVTIVNSLLTFVNTTPAIINPLLALPTLFRLAETGFDTNGYYMKNGQGSFRYNLQSQQLDLYDLYTNGKMSNFIVNSHFDFKTKKVNANVDISFLKDFTKAIRHIPILGYIIMGEDGELHTSVDISGTTDDPTLVTNTISEATSGVTGVLKRILTLPLLPFKGETTEEQRKEHEKRVEELLN